MTAFVLSLFARGSRHVQQRWRAARQRRHDRAELARLTAYELRDLGLSHRDVALRRESACRPC